MLSTAYQRGCTEALMRFGVKTARTLGATTVAPMAAAARPSVSWADVHKGVAQQQAANVNPHPAQLPAPLPAARAFEGQGSAAAGGGTGATTPPAGGGSDGGDVGRFMRPLGRGLGLAALGGAGALAYGMHRQNQEDREGRNLAYAPMQGTF